MMLTSNKMMLQPLLESSEGVHLTAYLVNRGNLIDLKNQLREAVRQADEWLRPVLGKEDRAKFIEPLDTLLFDARILKGMSGNIGIFRNKNFFRVINVPVKVEPTCQVATTFHVKPLLRWLQNDSEFLLLGLEKQSAHLYLGSQDSLKLIDSILFPDFASKDSRGKLTKKAETFTLINDWIFQLTKNTKPRLFLAGEDSLVEGIKRNLKYKNSVKISVSGRFCRTLVAEPCHSIRQILKVQSKKAFEKALLEFWFAEAGNRVQKNIFQIAKAIVRGKVKKLIVTDELNIFGQIDKQSGGLAIHPCDLNHEDDDLLDDLAQMVLSQGGEIIVASRHEIPQGRPILAILDDEGAELEGLEDLRRPEGRQPRIK